MIPPPVPACHGFADCAVIGAASASMKSESWRRMETMKLNILVVLRVVDGEVLSFFVD